MKRSFSMNVHNSIGFMMLTTIVMNSLQSNVLEPSFLMMYMFADDVVSITNSVHACCI